MLAFTLLATLVFAFAITPRMSRNRGVRLSPIGLAVTLLSSGCLVVGQLISHAFPVGVDPRDQSNDPLSGIIFLEAPSTVAAGLYDGGMLLLIATPLLLVFAAITRIYRIR